MNPDTYIAPVFSRFLDKAQRHIKYVVSTSSYVRTLQQNREILHARKNDIDRIINEGERRLKRATDEVTVWQSQVVDVLDRVDTAIIKAEETGSCVYSICTKHKLGHNCDDMSKEVDELLERASSFQNAEMVDCDTSNTAVLMPYVVPGSQEQYFAELCKCIEDDKSNVNIIGIWGPGGVGKTTLLSKIHNHFVGTSSMFETIIWTVASSKQSDIFRIQSEIAKKLRLKEDNDVQSQANTINRYLENKNFLLFIDDLWEGVDLHKVGVPINPDEAYHYGKKRKVIFTARFMAVCANMEAKKITEIKCLDLTQSLILFKQKVGEEAIQSHPAIPKLAEDIAKECKGLPLALITIGRAMSTKLNVEDWKYILNLLKDSEGYNYLGVEKQLLFVLKISYDNLATDRLKRCFLTISIWPEDQIIYPREIIDFWMGVDLIDNFESKCDAYKLGHSLIKRLQDACLLERVAGGTHYDCVRMHDILRDLALWLVSDCGQNENKWMVKAGLQMQKATNVKAKWREAECISLMRNKIKELPSGIPACPSLLTLVLMNNQLTGKSCFSNFHSLTYINLSGNCMNTFPESICDLANLRYLDLSANKITNLPMKLGNLKSLRYLILRHNCIINIPRGMFSELAELLVLDMFMAINTSKYPSVDVEELKSIEENLLSFGTSVRGEEELSKLMLLSELPLDELWIEGLVSTTFQLLAVIRDPHRLMTLYVQNSVSDLTEIVIDKNDTDLDFASMNLETLWLDGLEGLKKIRWKDVAPQILFAELQEIYINRCSCIEDITWIIYLPSLKYASIYDCESMKVAINNDGDVQVLTFPSLRVLILYKMDKLVKICTSTMAFPQLNGLSIAGCPLLKSLPFEVETTPKLRTIEGEKEWWNEVEWGDDNSLSHFNQFFRGG